MGWIIYLVSIADNLSCFFCLSSVGAILSSFVLTIFALMEKSLDWDNEAVAKGNVLLLFLRKKLIPIIMLLLPLAILTPDSKQIAAIYLIPKIANNEKLNGIADKGVDVLSLKLQQFMDDMTKHEETKK